MESSSSSSSLAAAANTNSTSSATSELFICFTSRLSSSSSMKLSSKSILSPGRARDSSQISLSSSLSRRLKNSGSLKGGQASPMFPTAAGKKRSGCAFENPEPSSPKVTCIGQVRVKTKKQGKKMRSRSAKRRSNNGGGGGGGGGEASFRRMEKEKKNKEEETTTQKLEENRSYNNSDSTNNNHHNQKWVTICEALRGFGAEFNCFLPCRSSCTTAAAEEKENGKADKRISTSSANGRSCGAAFARWLVALQDGEGKRREIELVVGEDEEREREERERSGGKSLRRRVFEGIEFKEEEIRKSCKDDGEEEEEKARVSICIPPKNALLLMRCRSDPVKMAALANRFWDPPQKDDNDEEDEDDDQEVNHEQEACEDDHHGGEAEAEVEELTQAVDRDDLHQQPEMCECEKKSVSSTTELVEREEDREESEQMKLDRKEDVVEEAAVEEAVMEVENEENPKRISTDDQVVVDIGGLWDEAREVVEPAEEQDCKRHQQQEDNGGDVKEEEGEEDKDAEDGEKKKQDLDHVIQSRQELQEQKTDLSGLFSDETFVDLEDEEKVEEEHVQDEEDDSHCLEEEPKMEEKAEEEVAEGSTEEEEATEQETREEKTGRVDPKEEREMGSPGLPDCLLLMMCEPKLSMEVSKETWVCSTDFIRWLPERRRVNPKKAPEEPKKRPNAAAVAAAVDGPQVMQPPRSSCSFPVTGTAVPESMASVIQQKLVGTKPPYEPFVLTRCKSEPMRSAAKLAPDACFWKNRKVEPHRPATLGVGAAGVGF